MCQYASASRTALRSARFRCLRLARPALNSGVCCRRGRGFSSLGFGRGAFGCDVGSESVVARGGTIACGSALTSALSRGGAFGCDAGGGIGFATVGAAGGGIGFATVSRLGSRGSRSLALFATASRLSSRASQSLTLNTASRVCLAESDPSAVRLDSAGCHPTLAVCASLGLLGMGAAPAVIAFLGAIAIAEPKWLLSMRCLS